MNTWDFLFQDNYHLKLTFIIKQWLCMGSFAEEQVSGILEFMSMILK